MRVERVSAQVLPSTSASSETAQGRKHEAQPDTGESSGSGRYLRESGTERDRERLDSQIDRLNKLVRAFDTRLSFHVHEGSDQMIVQVVDTKTNEVIKEIPPEAILDVVAKVRDMVGFLVDERA